MWQRLKQSLWINLVLGVIAGFVLYGAAVTLHQTLTVREQSAETRAEIETLRRRKAELEAAIRALQDPETIRREAKEELNLKLPGEEVLVVIPPEEPTSEPVPLGWGERIQHFFRRILP